MICEHTPQLDIRRLAKLVNVIPDVIDLNGERILTEWTKTNFGGHRQWFLCPNCDRRCAIIYKKGDGPRYCCRVCGGGRYLTEHRSPKDRKLIKAIKVRRKLGQAEGGYDRSFPPRPKWMRVAVYDRIREETQAVETEILLAEYARFRRLTVEEAREHFV